MALITDQFSNFAYSTLAGGGSGAGGALTATDTTLTVKSGDGAKYSATTGGSFMVMLGSALGAHEMVKVTARTGDTLTIARGQEGTTAQAWALGTFVQQVATAGNWATLWDRVQGVVFNVKDYGAVGDGVTDDTAAIQAALTAAHTANGGAVFIPAGVYIVSADLLVYSNTLVYGVGRASILRAKATTGPNLLNVTGMSHVVISDLQIDGNSVNTIQPATQYSEYSGIWLHGNDDVTITRCYIHSCWSSGVMANGGCTNLIISNNHLDSNWDNQIYVRAYVQTPYNPCEYVTITGNICSNGSFSGIQVLGSSYIAITGNECHHNGPTQSQGDGIGSEGSSYVTITGNTCYNNGVQGIQTRFTNEVGPTLQQSSHIVISGNVCYQNASTNSDAGGIGVNDTDDVLVSGNLTYDNGFNINVNAGSIGFSNVSVIGNQVRTSADAGIRVVPPSGQTPTVVIADNFIDHAGTDGIYATTRILVRGCVIQYTAGSYSGGVHLDTGADGSIIDACVITDGQNNGVLVGGTCANVLIRNCDFDNIGTPTQQRSAYEEGTAGPTYLINNRIRNQTNQPYYFANAASRNSDEHTLETVLVTASYAVQVDDNVILCSASAALTVTLPSASVASFGHVYTIKDHSGNSNTYAITVATSSSQTIDSAATRVINTAFGVLRVISDGYNWSVI